VIPDLDDLSVVAEAKDVYAGEGHVLSSRCYIAQAPECVPSAVQRAATRSQVDPPLEVRKGAAELLGDQRLARATRRRLRRAKIMPNILVREHLLREANIPSGPGLVIETPKSALFASTFIRRPQSYGLASGT
jgi:hypothetical protein